MKRILPLIISLLLPASSFSAGLPINFSKEFKYKAYTMNGIDFMIHSSLSDNKRELIRSIEYITKIFSEVEKTIPNTTKEFKKEKCKIILYELNFSKGGMEYVRKNQSSWDKRHNKLTDHSVIIATAYTYSKTGHNGFAYLLHEMTHFHHLHILKNKFDKDIKRLYKLARNNPKYVGTYASSNYLEYFAEISTAYLLESHRTSKFPKGSRELYIHDRGAYDLCVKIWGKDLAAYKPPIARFPVSGAAYLPYRPVAAVKHNPNCRCTKCSTDHAMSVFKVPTDEEVRLSKAFLDVVHLTNRADIETDPATAGFMYNTALMMLIDFMNEYPNFRPGVMTDMIRSLKSKIN